MEEAESSRSKHSNSTTKLFLDNTRSAKVKSTEIAMATHDHDIICLTETHLDDSIEPRTVIETAGFDFFRKDRSLRGGGVLVVIESVHQATEIQLNTKEELVAVKVSPHLIICCCYRPNVDTPNIDVVDDNITTLTKQHPKPNIFGDFNLPGTDGNTLQKCNNTPCKRNHQLFIDLLTHHSLTQLILEPTCTG